MRRFRINKLLLPWVTFVTLALALFAADARAQQQRGASPAGFQSEPSSPRFSQVPPPASSQPLPAPQGPQAPPPPAAQQRPAFPPAPQQSQAPLAMPPGAPVSVWMLSQVEATSLQFNPIMRRSVARIVSAQGDAQQASLYPNPRFDTNNPEVFAGNASSYNMGFMQQIVVKGKLRLDRAAANEVVRQREHGLVQDRYALLTAVRQQFYTMYAAQRRVAVLTEMRDILAGAVKAAEGRRLATEGTLSEVLLAKTELFQAESALRNASINLEAQRRQLATIVGRPDFRFEKVDGPFATGFPNYDPNFLRNFVVSENAQVQIARREIEHQLFLLQRARVEPYPNISVGEAYSNNLVATPGSQQFWMTLQFDIPIYNRNQGNIRSAQGSLAEAMASLGALQNGLLTQVEAVLGSYATIRQTEERMRLEIVPNARQAQQLTEDGYRKGVLDISTYLQANRTLTQALSNYLDTLESVWETAAQIAGLLQAERFP